MVDPEPSSGATPASPITIEIIEEEAQLGPELSPAQEKFRQNECQAVREANDQLQCTPRGLLLRGASTEVAATAATAASVSVSGLAAASTALEAAAAAQTAILLVLVLERGRGEQANEHFAHSTAATAAAVSQAMMRYVPKRQALLLFPLFASNPI